MTVMIDGLVFERSNCDTDGDVLYLASGESNMAADAVLTPEGHGVRYGPDGEVIGVTIINARWLLERDGYLTITVPHSVCVEAGELAAALG
jgi:uncharacterized protein YuzE